MLRSLSLYTSLSFPPDSAVALVDTLVKCAAPLHVEITGLQPGDQATSRNTTPEANVTPLKGLAGIAATVTVRGRFTDVVRLVQRLSRQRLPIDVQRVQISRVDQLNGAPLVESAIDVVAFHLVLPKVPDATAN